MAKCQHQHVLFFGRGRGCGARSPANAENFRSVVETVLLYNEAAESGGQDLSCSPFSAEKWHGKNPDGQGFKGGDFFAAYKRKNTPGP